MVLRVILKSIGLGGLMLASISGNAGLGSMICALFSLNFFLNRFGD